MARYVMERTRLGSGFNELRHEVPSVHQLLAPEYKRLEQTKSRETNALALRATGVCTTEEQCNDYLIYDAFFRVIRLSSMTAREFAAQATLIAGSIQSWGGFVASTKGGTTEVAAGTACQVYDGRLACIVRLPARRISSVGRRSRRLMH